MVTVPSHMAAGASGMTPAQFYQAQHPASHAQAPPSHQLPAGFSMTSGGSSSGTAAGPAASRPPLPLPPPQPAPASAPGPGYTSEMPGPTPASVASPAGMRPPSVGPPSSYSGMLNTTGSGAGAHHATYVSSPISANGNGFPHQRIPSQQQHQQLPQAQVQSNGAHSSGMMASPALSARSRAGTPQQPQLAQFAGSGAPTPVQMQRQGSQYSQYSEGGQAANAVLSSMPPGHHRSASSSSAHYMGGPNYIGPRVPSSQPRASPAVSERLLSGGVPVPTQQPQPARVGAVYASELDRVKAEKIAVDREAAQMINKAAQAAFKDGLPLFPPGAAVVRFLQYSEAMSAGETKNDPSYWRTFVDEFYMPEGVFRLTLCNPVTGEHKPFEVPNCVLPRFMMTAFVAGMASCQLSLENPREYTKPLDPQAAAGQWYPPRRPPPPNAMRALPPLASGAVTHVVEASRAMMMGTYKSGWQVQMIGVLRASMVPHSRLVIRELPGRKPKLVMETQLRFECLDYVVQTHTSFIPRFAIQSVKVEQRIPQHAIDSILLAAARQGGVKQEPNGDEHVPQRTSHRIPVEKLQLPECPVNEYGVTLRAMRCLEICESVCGLRDLMDFSLQESIGAVDAMRRFAAAEVAQNESVRSETVRQEAVRAAAATRASAHSRSRSSSVNPAGTPAANGQGAAAEQGQGTGTRGATPSERANASAPDSRGGTPASTRPGSSAATPWNASASNGGLKRKGPGNAADGMGTGDGMEQSPRIGSNHGTPVPQSPAVASKRAKIGAAE